MSIASLINMHVFYLSTTLSQDIFWSVIKHANVVLDLQDEVQFSTLPMIIVASFISGARDVIQLLMKGSNFILNSRLFWEA